MPDDASASLPDSASWRVPDVDFTKSRVILFDQDDRVLLFFTKAPVDTNPTRWVTPGGHLEPGETFREAAARELFEETGLNVPVDEFSAPVWSREFTDERAPGVFKTNYEQWFVIRTRQFEPSDAGWMPDEKVDMLASRWWSVDELESTDELFEPAESLVQVIRNQLE